MANTSTPFDYDISKFEVVRKGIEPQAVKGMLDECRSEWRKLEQRADELTEKVALYESERASVTNALISAQKAADDILRDAQAQAEQHLAETRAEADRVSADHHAALRELQSEMESLAVGKQKFADDFRALLRGYLAELDARFPLQTARLSPPPTTFEPPEPKSEAEAPLSAIPDDSTQAVDAASD